MDEILTTVIVSTLCFIAYLIAENKLTEKIWLGSMIIGLGIGVMSVLVGG